MRRFFHLSSARRPVLSVFSACLFIVALLAAVPLALVGSSPARADTNLPDTSFITWNMQGSTVQGASLWSDYLPPVLTSHTHAGMQGSTARVLMLQEVGAGVPPSATPRANPTNDSRVTYATWTGAGASRARPWAMYFLQSNNPSSTATGGRVNTIVMFRTALDGNGNPIGADQVMVVNPSPSTSANASPRRPAIGIRLGNDWYFSFHALTGGGGDAASMLHAIADAVEAAQPAGVTYNWTVGGDFNTAPRNLYNRADFPLINNPNSPTGPNIIASGQATHLNAATQSYDQELDYAVTTVPVSPIIGHPQLGQTAVGYPMAAQTLTNNGASDHLPVMVFEYPQGRATTASAPSAYNSSTMVIGGNAAIGSNSPGTNWRGGYAFCARNGHLSSCSTTIRRGVTSNNSVTRNYAQVVEYAVASAPASRVRESVLAADPGASAATGASTYPAPGDTLNLNFVGSVSAGDVPAADGGDEVEAFPGESIAQLQQHLVTDLPLYRPDTILLQLDVASDLDSGVAASAEASALQGLLNQIFDILPNTTVLLGDPAPSVNATTEAAMYAGSDSYISQSDQIVEGMQQTGHEIDPVANGFEGNTADLDASQAADGVPNDTGYASMAANYASAWLALKDTGTVADPSGVIVNPTGFVDDGTGVDDTGQATGDSSAQNTDKGPSGQNTSMP
jgi:hypothetical protein